MSEIQTVQAEVISIETEINDKLVKANITDQVIAGLKEKYLPLKINGIEDKEGYKAVKEARKDCKQWRIAAEKICKTGREDAVKVSKAWVAKEKEVTSKISEIEDYLQKQEDDYEAEKERIAAEEKIRIEKIFAERSSELNKYGAFFDGSNYILGDASIELSNVKGLDDEMWNEKVIPKFKAIFEAKEAERIEQERLKKEEEDRIAQEREKLRKEQEEFERQKEQLRLQQEEADRKEKERLSEEQRLKEEQEKKKIKDRCNQLMQLGMKFNFEYNSYLFEDVNIHAATEVSLLTDEEWDALINKITPAIEIRKEEKIKKEQEAIEEKKRIAAEEAVEKERQRVAEENRLAEEKRLEDERKKAEALEQAKDKEKWNEVVTYLSATPVFEMRSSQYRTKMKAVKDFLATLK